LCKHNVLHVNQKAIALSGKLRDRLYHPIEGFKIMPQTTTTVTSCVKPVEELRSVEISFEDHEFYAGQKLVARITHDDDLTQPWIVMVNGEEIHARTLLKDATATSHGITSAEHCPYKKKKPQSLQRGTKSWYRLLMNAKSTALKS